MTAFEIVISVIGGSLLLVYSIALFLVFRVTRRRSRMFRDRIKRRIEQAKTEGSRETQQRWEA